MNIRCSNIIGPDELVFIIYENMVFVSVIVDEVLLRPTSIDILLGHLFRILFKPEFPVYCNLPSRKIITRILNYSITSNNKPKIWQNRASLQKLYCNEIKNRLTLFLLGIAFYRYNVHGNSGWNEAGGVTPSFL